MRFEVHVKTNAPRTEIISEHNGIYKVRLKAKPQKNQANIELIKLFAKELGQPVTITSGLSSKRKILETLA